MTIDLENLNSVSGEGREDKPQPVTPQASTRSLLARAIICSTIIAVSAIGTILYNVRRSETVQESPRTDLQRTLGGNQVQMSVTSTTATANLESSIGCSIDVVTLYQALSSTTWNGLFYRIKQELSQGRDVVLVAEFDGYSLAQISGGAADGAMYDLAQAIKGIDGLLRSTGTTLWIRALHEMNGDWYSWGVYLKTQGNNNDLFKSAFRHVVTKMKGYTNYSPNIKYQLSYNCQNAHDDDMPFSYLFPGGDVVDMILCSGYNRHGVTGEAYHPWESFSEVFGPGYYQMLAINSGKPLGVAETGSTGQGDKTGWLKDAFWQISNKFTKVQQVNFFLIDKPDSRDWNLHTDDQRKAFRDGVWSLR